MPENIQELEPIEPPTAKEVALIREAYDQGFAAGLEEAERRYAQIQYLLHCSGGNA